MKKSTLFLIILVAIFFTSTLALIKLNYLKPQSTTISTASITPTVTRDSTADWKIYENKDFGISFLYPENYFFEKMPDNEYSGIYFWKNGSDTKSYYEYIPMLGGEKPKDFPLFVMQRYNEEIRTLLTAPENQSGPIEMSFVKDIDNINTLFKVYLFGVSDIGQYCALETPFKKTITITCSDDQLKNPIFNQILSTFKFINTSQSLIPTTTLDLTTNWKTYTDNKNGFSLKHPTSFQPSSQIETIKNPDHLTVKQYSDRLVSDSKNDDLCPECYKVISEKEYIANGKIGLLQEVISSPGGRSTKFIATNSEAIIVLTHGFGDPETPILENSKQDFFQILSTFKFTNTTSKELPVSISAIFSAVKPNLTTYSNPIFVKDKWQLDVNSYSPKLTSIESLLTNKFNMKMTDEVGSGKGGQDTFENNKIICYLGWGRNDDGAPETWIEANSFAYLSCAEK